MATTWILVAHEAGARIFVSNGPGKGLVLVEETENPQGRARDGELESDRPGRSFRKHSADPRRAALGGSEGPRERIVADFARAIADTLRRARIANTYDRLVLVAPPKFLGVVRAALDDPTRSRVVGSLNKDLRTLSEDALVAHLGEFIAP